MEDELDKGSEMALFIVKGEKDGVMTPIAKLPGGKIVLFGTEYHEHIKPGETWRCRITDNTPNYCFAYPIERISGVSGSDRHKSLPPKLSQLLVEKVTDEIEAKRSLIETLEDELEGLKKNNEVDRDRYLQSKTALEEVELQRDTAMEDVNYLEGVLDEYVPQTVSIGDIDEDILKQAMPDV